MHIDNAAEHPATWRPTIVHKGNGIQKYLNSHPLFISKTITDMGENPECIYSTFEYTFDSDDPVAIEDHRRALQEFRDKASRQPLDTSTVFPLKLRLQAQHSPNTRPVPWFAFESPDEDRSYSCQLLEPLRTGFDRHSQIWVAEVLYNGTEEVSDHGDMTKSSKIVLKIFQQSLSTLPTVEGIQNIDGTYVILEEHAKNEELAYTILKDLQGTYVPYCYGLHEVTTPSGEQAWALALEYIDGTDIQELGKSCKLEKDAELNPGKLETLCEVYRAATKAIRAVQDLKVHHLVKSANNYIALSDSTFVVVIDFAITDFRMTRMARVGGMQGACQCILDAFADYKDAVQSWVNINIARDEFKGYVTLKPEYYCEGYQSDKDV